MRHYTHYYYGGRKTAICILLCLGLGWGLAGCAMDTKKASSQADKDVYQILDKKWLKTFKENTNYRLQNNGLIDPNNVVLAKIAKTGKLNLADAIELSIAASPEYQEAKEQLYLAGLDQTDAEHLYDMTPFASLAAGQSKITQSSSRSGDIYENEIRGGSGTVGVQKMLATGAVITSDLTLGSFDVVSGQYRSGPASIFQTVVSQPLLRGSDRKVVFETLTQAQRNTLYEIRTFNRFRKTFYVSVIDDYYRLIKYSQQVYNASENLLKLKTILLKMETLVQVGKVELFDLDRARQNVLKASDDFFQLKQIYEETLDLYKLRLLIPQNMAIVPDINDWYQLEKNANSEIAINEQQSLEIAMAARLDLANAFDQVEDAERHTEVVADSLGADLTLVGMAAPASRQRFTFGAKPGDIQRTQERYELSLRANLPLDRETERNNYKRTLIALIQAQRTHQQLTNQVEMEVRKDWRDMTQARNRLSMQIRSRDLASTRLSSTLLLMQYGKANTMDVLDCQRDYRTAQENYAAALTDLAMAKMKFLRDTETLWINPEGQYQQQIALGQK
jgi:outer membrane protein TolC